MAKFAINTHTQPTNLRRRGFIGAGYAMFIVYSALGIKRIHEHIKQYFLVERCVSCRVYGVSNVELISYITFWSIDLAIDVQQLPEDLFDMVVWKRCIWAGALFVANIYAFLLTCVVLQLVYYQHCIVIEEQILREQRQALNDGERFRNLRRQRMRLNQRLNAIPVADVHIQNIEIV
ncbi:unnamed protein product [Gongylonema pulchrum]|uniref:Anoctamin n=1 Tax=Gongylonema pulchrum TaxID=637853 RepID=A0A183EH55_9BILA|nr:unnamed protein product [Gongylonema pulchrum]